jgi:DNA modification methylase
MMERVMNSSCPYGEIVVEPFLGSGPTLIGAERTGRKCYGMELDPRYVDVVVKRWEDYTGKKAKRV